jgi:hypothetical protein
MIDPDEDVSPFSDDVLALAELTEEISRRLESGEPVDGSDLGDNPESAGPIRQLLPALRTMVSLGEQVVREEGSRIRSKRKKKRTSSSPLDAIPEVEEGDP